MQHRDGTRASTATHEDADGPLLMWLRTSQYQHADVLAEHRIVLSAPQDGRGETWLDPRQARLLAALLLAAARSVEDAAGRAQQASIGLPDRPLVRGAASRTPHAVCTSTENDEGS